MRRILAIAGLAMRNAVRSRMVLSLLALLALCVVVLPLTIQGDDTIKGQVQILLSYSLGFATALLSIATVWSGCAAVSMDIKDRHIHMVVSKPVHRAQIWLGKWLGLLFLNAILLTATGLSVYGALQWRIRPGQISAEEQRELERDILVSRRVLQPEKPDVRAAARAAFDALEQEGRLDGSVSPEQQLVTLERTELIKAFSVEPGARRVWTVALGALPPDTPCYLRYRFRISKVSQEEVFGMWLFGGEEGRSPYAYRTSHVPDSRQTIEIPQQAIHEGVLRLEFANVHPQPLTVLFDPDEGIEIMYSQDRFELNLLRSLLVVFCQIAFLAALSVTAGTCFTMPVASFFTIALTVMLLFNRTIQSIAETGAQATGSTSWLGRLFNYLVSLLYAFIARLLRPLQQSSPLELLAGGEMISWSMLAEHALIRLGLYSGLLALAGFWIFQRKEVGRPQ